MIAIRRNTGRMNEQSKCLKRRSEGHCVILDTNASFSGGQQPLGIAHRLDDELAPAEEAEENGN